MAYDYSARLKEGKVCRIFFSSPFNGMEGEREELTRRYWPQIHHLCNSKGLQFVAVDMRWGITKESADSAQVATICLRELDRSDLFVGFFGQRYGWHGVDDDALQQNFNNAVGRYPWLDDFRDRSVTELEFLHGHLNNPGKLPACIAFRDKGWDDVKRKAGEEAGNKREIYKYSSESDTATMRMNDLKRRVKETEEQLIGLDLSYPTPKEGAKFMFDCIWKYLKEVLLADPEVPSSRRQIEKSLHATFLTKLCNHYVGGESYLTKLDEWVDGESCRQLLLLGEHGSGKSALLGNWFRRRNTKDTIIVYHFIGASTDSTGFRAILSRLTAELHHEMCVRKGEEGMDSERPLDYNISVNTLVDDFSAKINEISKMGIKTVIIIDGLEKLTGLGKTGEILFWLPRTFPSSVHLIVSTVPEDYSRTKVLIEDRKFTTLSLDPLTEDERSQLCVDLLRDSGKELSSHQLELVVSPEKTGNPLFLKVVIEELCVFGYFFKLDKKIESLVESRSTEDLFDKYLERLEKDYNDNSTLSNLVEQVACAIFIAEERIQEGDLLAMLDIPSYVWSPLFFAMEKTLVTKSGLLGFAYTALRSAIKNRYLSKEEDVSHYKGKLVAYFDSLVQKCKDEKEEVPDYVVQILPRLDCRRHTLLDLSIFSPLCERYVYDLLDHWTKIETDQVRIANDYLKQIDVKETDIYFQAREEYREPSVAREVFPYLKALDEFMSIAGFFQGRYIVLQRMNQLLENCQATSPDFYQKEYFTVLYKLGTHLADIGRLDESEKLLLKVKEEKVRTNDVDGLMPTIHGLAVTYLHKHENAKSEELFTEYIRLVNERTYEHAYKCDLLSTAYCNLGNICLRTQRFEEAAVNMEKALKMAQEKTLGELTSGVGEMMTNLGQSYRRLMRLEEAEDLYLKALEIKINAVGLNHISLAISYGNMSVLETIKGNHDKSYEFILKTYALQRAALAEDHEDLLKTTENIVNSLVQLKRFEDAEPYFWIVFEQLVKKGQYNMCLPWLQQKMVNYFLNSDQLDKARKVLPHLAPIEETGLAYRQIHQLDTSLPEEQRPIRPKELSIDAGFKRLPNSGILFKYKYEIDLIPNEDFEGLKSLFDAYLAAIKSLGTEEEIRDHAVNTMLLGMAGFCEEKAKITLLVDILEYGLILYPDNETLERTLYPKYAHTKIGRCNDALSLVRKLCDLHPTEVALHMHAVQICSNLSKVAEGLQYCDVLEKHHSGDEELMKKVNGVRTMLKESLNTEEVSR